MRIAPSLGRVAALIAFAAVTTARLDAAYAAKKHKHQGPPHSEQSSPPSNGAQQPPPGPPDPGSYK